MNTLAVFGLTASVAIGTVIGVLFGMCWVERRMLGSGAKRRSRSVVSAARPRAAIRIRMMLSARRAGLAARSAITAGAALAGTALFVGKQGDPKARRMPAGASVPSGTGESSP
jgi:hypothetical protein